MSNNNFEYNKDWNLNARFNPTADTDESAVNKRSTIIEFLGISKKGSTYLNSINRFKNHEDTDFLSSGISYFFFTKPQLNLTGQSDTALKIHYPFLYAYKDNMLYRKLFNGKDFVHPLCNLGTGFDTHDVVMETDEYSETFRGYKMVAPTTPVKSQITGDFSIEYMETSDMFVTTYHKIWFDYMQGVREGVLKPVPGAIKGLSNKTGKTRTGYIDYMCSVYYFLLDVDGSTIKYWAKYTGVFPTNIPFSTFKWEQGNTGLKKLNISYQYNFKEDMNPVLFEEFNKITLCDTSTSEGTLSHEARYNWATSAYVARVNGSHKLLFK